ncbi:MAG TPA: IS256 family transposase [Thermodesulfovibrionales bacterium]|nr:IS256 family transposase [Thermodesulfovibrionales bacterium]
MRSLSKKSKKIIEKSIEGHMQLSSLAELTKIGARMMLEVAIEEELTAFLGRDYYERRNGQEGSRSGSKPRTIKVGCGDIEIEMPRVRDAGRPFHSELLPPGVTRMEEIQDIISLLYMNGISTRKVKKSVAKLLGKRGLSHQNIIRITEKVVEEFRQWKRRDLTELKVAYLILDGTRLAVRAGTREKEAVLVAWGFLEDGSLEPLSISLGSQESYNAWKWFLEDMVKRGLQEPILVVIDGCPGLVKAVKEVFSVSDIQRCTKHKTENVLDKVLKEDREKVKDSLRKIFYALTYDHAKEAVELFKGKWGRKYSSAVEILTEDIELCLTYYKYPYRHWKRIRTTNVVERSFREVKRRTKGIGRFQDEQRALAMVYWQLKELRWYGVSMTKEARAILSAIKVSKLERIAA